MDSSAAKMKQKPINAFFAAAGRKEADGPKSSQKKISAFFGGSSKPSSAPDGVPAAKAPGDPIVTPQAAADATPGARLSPDLATGMKAAAPNSMLETKAKEPLSAKAVSAAPKAAKTPAGGSTSKPRAPRESGSVKASVKAKGNVKAKAGGASLRRLRKVVMDDEEGGGDVEAGLEDEVEDKSQEDSDYEAGCSGSGSDEDFSAEEEDDGEEEEEHAASESDGDNVGVGAKRKRPPTKNSTPAKRTTAAVKAKSDAAAATPAGARTPAVAARADAVTTPHHGTASKGPASATARITGRSSLATPGTVAPALGAYGSAGRSRPATGGTTTPSSVRSVRTALADTPSKSEGTSEVTLGVAATMEGEAARFADRMAQRFPFLQPDNIMDANKRRPDDPEYNPRTLYIPPNWFKEYKISDGQQQWWNFKAANFDSVILFKMGKFYEMFEMDAYVGVDVLGLTFMKGEQPHAGFPEVKYADMAESLARAGYRVVVVEQTETPEMLAKRNEQRKQKGLKMANVVERQKVAVLSRGTLVDAEMVASRPDASYVLAVYEQEEAAGSGDAASADNASSVRIGLCAVDAASGQVLLGEFRDDEVRSCLRTQLTALQPQELVLPRKPLSTTTSHVLRNGVRDPRVNVLRGGAGDWSSEKTYCALRDEDYFTASNATSADGAAPGDGCTDMDVDGDAAKAAGGGAWPPPELDPSKRWPALLRRILVDGVASRPAAMSALGGIIAFLRDSMLDRAVLPLGRFEELPALPPRAAGADGEGADGRAQEPLYLALNGAALENLEILENSEGGSAGTLLSVLDHCTTPFGRRRLRQWLCRPLGRIADITARQDAVAELMGGLADAAGQARKLLAGVSDLERAITRLHAATVAGASGRDAANVVLYEDAGKRKVAALTAALKDLRAAHGALARLREGMQAGGAGGGSALLQRIVVERGRPAEVSAALEVLEGATDWKDAALTGRAVPEPGVDEDYDAAVEDVRAVERKLQDYVKELRQRFGRDVNLVSVNKDSNLLEVPEAVASKLGGEFHLVGNRKGFKRFTSNKLKAMAAEVDKAMEVKENALSSILARLVVKFVSHKALWVAVVEAVAELDALMSLAAHAMSPPDGGPMCRPQLVPSCRKAGGQDAQESQGPGSSALFNAVALRHPAGIGGRNNGAFVPNDIRLGGGPEYGMAERAPPFILLSGPNMGGKSTLLRQVCLATVLAQVGAWVPAESLTLSTADAIFVRMGARDSIMTGQSTFFIELAETAAMLAKATGDSLVALDELGRGTATLDGAAVAGAVLQQLASSTGCRGLFATHYHHLSDEHTADPRVAVMHMACVVEGEGEGEEAAQMEPASRGQQVSTDGNQEVTFLYRLTHGACPKSYGTNVARLAGLPPSVVARAAQVSAQWDEQQQTQQQVQELQGSAGRVQEKRGVDAMEVEAGCLSAAQNGGGAVADGSRLRALLKDVCTCLTAPAEEAEGAAVRLRELQAVAAGLLGQVAA